jgi:hypothetical protein
MSGMTVNVDKELVEPIVRAEIEAAIVCQLQNTENLIPNLVTAALSDKVDERGKKSQYRSSNKYLYIDILCRDAIKDASREAMKEYIEENTEKLALEVKKQIRKSEAELARIFVDGLVGSLKSSWNFKIDVRLPGDDK